MAMAVVTLTFSFFFLLLSTFAFADTGFVGINYGRVANNLPTPPKVVELLKSKGIIKVKLYDTDSAVLTAFANSGISLVVTLPNEVLSNAANDQSFADNWVQANITKYYPATKIEAIAVGNEVFVDQKNTPYLVPAMTKIYNSLVKYKLDSAIKVSSPIALSALNNSYPASAGIFKPELVSVVKPMLELLRKSGSYVMVNIYPFFAYSANSKDISLDYALFKTNPGVVDSGNGLKYSNMLEAQVDAVYAAMSAIGFNDVKLTVSETGWPSLGDENEIGASKENAAAYNGNLMVTVQSGSGTPVRPKDPLNVYLFALFNENLKPGPTSERNYGLFYPTQEQVYDMPFTQGQGQSGNSTIHDQVPSPASSPNPRVTTNSTGPDVTPTPTSTPTSTQGQSWCVANANVEVSKLQNGLDYACGEGGADCRPIQEGATCYDPNTLEAHASYAFNSYYQKQGRKAGSCNFGGTARVVNEHPGFGGNCEYPTGY
ncbi:hypothetical protein Pint_04050 [Pistacia integerrima]|uniref:Uncharacterized protein n=1 Tax=Pistacia integerrima TaxID=434235 RepID=A0ACC0Z3B1_9ROSI|nr:hypothetical protein Pint_04050 [Pistacia integerrima]